MTTNQNLQIAYGRAMQFCSTCKLFVLQADKERNVNVASLFRAIAHSEEIQAKNQSAILPARGIEPVTELKEPPTIGTMAQTLKMALSSEDLVPGNFYPGLIRTAEIEGDSVALEECRMAQAVDERHRQLLFDAINARAKASRVHYFTCSACGYVFTSENFEECPVCRAKKEKFERV